LAEGGPGPTETVCPGTATSVHDEPHSVRAAASSPLKIEVFEVAEDTLAAAKP